MGASPDHCPLTVKEISKSIGASLECSSILHELIFFATHFPSKNAFDITFDINIWNSKSSGRYLLSRTFLKAERFCCGLQFTIKQHFRSPKID